MAKVFPTTLKQFEAPTSAEQAVSGLWRIDEIILNTTDIQALSEKIVNVMLEELGYLRLGYVIIVLSLLDKEKRYLKRVSISHTEAAGKALEQSPVSFKNLVFKMEDQENLPVRALRENRAYLTEDLADMLYPAIEKDVVQRAQKVLGVVTSLAFPITAHSEALGTIIFSLNKPESQISEFERQILIGFTNAAGIAIQHAYLFRQLHEANEKLQELDKRKDEFLSIAAHELRAPMTAIKGYLSMILEGDAGKITPEVIDYLGEARDGNDRLIRLVNNMLNVSRIEEGRMVFQMGTVSLAKAVITVFHEFEAEAKQRGLAYSLGVSQVIDDTVYVDQDRIHEVMANFMSNAIKYTDQGSVTVKLFNKESMVRFEVKDTGPGISQADLGKLFQKFSRVESSAGKKIGTGLGLYIAKLLIEEFGGKIGVESKMGKGSTFWFELPLETGKVI